MDTLSEVMKALQQQGYALNLRIGEDGRIDDDDRSWGVDDVVVERVYRFEGMSSADDSSMLMAMVVANGEKGLLSLPYGPDANGAQADTIRALTVKRPTNS